MTDSEGADLNKSELTLRVTEAADLWLSEIGCKPVETEVPVAVGWVADLAGVWIPTMTEAQKAKLIPRRPATKHPYGSAAYKDHYEKVKLWRQRTQPVLEYLPHPVTVILEAKTTRADFRSDPKWARSPVANIQVLSVVRGISKAREWPPDWWILEHSAKTGKLLNVRRPGKVFHGISDEQRLEIVLQTAMRLHNRVNYQRLRDIQRRQRRGEAKSATLRRVSHIARMVLAVVRAEDKDIETCCHHHLHWGEKLPDYIRKDLEKLWGIAKPKEGAHAKQD